MFCAISGEAAQNPVVNKKTGAVYEKSLIQKYMADNGNKDPVTSEELTQDDLLEVKTSPAFTPARPPSHSSLPSLLSTLQSEYDSLILETYALKRNYDSVRQELAHALYANDAANRVVARLIGERDGAREALAQIQNTLGVSGGNVATGNGDSEMADGSGSNEGGLSQETLSLLQSSVQKLSASRKGRSKRKAPATYATAADVKNFDQISTLPSLHSTKPPGVSSMDLSSNGAYLVTGGNDSQICVYERSSSKILSTLKGHTKKVTQVLFSKSGEIIDVGPQAGGGESVKPSHIISCSEQDKSIRIWKSIDGEEVGYEASLTIPLKSEITGLAIHPCGTLFGSTTRDGNLSLWETESGKNLLSLDPPGLGSVNSEESIGGYKYESLSFHPDGQLVATGTQEGCVRIWDLFTCSNVTTFRPDTSSDSTDGSVISTSFSENGYYFSMVTKGSKDVKVWDLRKQTLVGVLEASNGVNMVVFDPSGQFVATVGVEVKVFNNKSWVLLKTFDGNTNTLESARWDPRDGTLLVTGIDRTLRVLGSAGLEE